MREKGRRGTIMRMLTSRSSMYGGLLRNSRGTDGEITGQRIRGIYTRSESDTVTCMELYDAEKLRRFGDASWGLWRSMPGE